MVETSQAEASGMTFPSRNDHRLVIRLKEESPEKPGFSTQSFPLSDDCLVYSQARARPDTPRKATSFSWSTSRFPLQAEARMICARFF